MRRLQSICYRATALFRRRTHEDEMTEELRSHLEGLVERNVAAGLSPADARHAALRAFGGVEQLKERCRDQRRFRWLEEGAQDFRHAVRLLAHSPGFTIVAVLSLVIGIGANTAVFTVCDAILLKSLPVAHPQELVVLGHRGKFDGAAPRWIESDGDRPAESDAERTAGGAFSPAVFERLRARSSDLADLFAFAPLSQLGVLVDGQPDVVPLTEVVSGNYFSGLGVRPWLGRVLGPADDRTDATPAAVISFRCWQRRFARDPAVVGRVVWLNNVPVTIAGVAPAEFAGTLQVGEAPEFFVPLVLAARLRPDRSGRFDARQPGFWWLRVMGRLAPGVTPERLQARLGEVFRESVIETFPGTPTDSGALQLVVEPGRRGPDEARRSYRQSLLVLAGIAGIVLLIACVNVANLLLARATARRREIAVRLALGASGGRLVRQLLTESLLLALLGAGFGALLAWWGKDLLPGVLPAGTGALVLDLHLDWRVLGLTTAVAVVSGTLFGLVPAVQATRLELKAEFQGAGSSRGAGGFAPARALIVVQVALSLVLLVGAGLFGGTVRNLQAVDVGFNRSRLLLFQIDAVGAGRNRDQVAGLYRRLNERLAVLPGVRGSTFSLQPLLGGRSPVRDGLFRPATGAGTSAEPAVAVDVNGVGPGFFTTFEIPILQGRALDARDEAPGAGAVVVNETLARTFFPGENPLGQRTRWGEIVGVVGDTSFGDLKRPLAPAACVPFAHAGVPDARGNFAVRTTGNPLDLLPSIRRAVRNVDPKLPLFDVRTQDADVDRLLQQERLFARLSRVFGGLALALVCVGLYGLMSYAVLRRSTEIGIRLALGARPAAVRRMILRESLGLVGVGLAIGLAAAAILAPQIAGLLFGLSPYDPATYGGVALALLAVGVAACWVPARRAARIDAMTALRCE